MIKLTKNELKLQRDSLKRFQRYLPTLHLKKQQLQMVIRRTERELQEVRSHRESILQGLQEWVGVFGEDIDITHYVQVSELQITQENVSGVDVPVFQSIQFADVHWDLLRTPMWVDTGVSTLRGIFAYDMKIDILQQQLVLLQHELRITTQRVNLFEKVKIPEAQENIKRIRIYLGDQQTAAVVRGKIAKRSLIQVSI